MILSLKKFFTKIKKWFIKLVNRKHFLDFVVATLTIPVLLTVLITNIMNLQAKNKTETGEKQIIIKNENSKNPPSTETVEKIVVTPSENCKKEIGPISITSPEENEEVADNPVCLTIKHDNENYCSVVWSYRINNGSWSEYNSNSVCLYDAPKGKIKFDLRIQSTVSNDQETLSRSFIYNGTSTSSALTN